jgi:hypothetical protein
MAFSPHRYSMGNRVGAVWIRWDIKMETYRRISRQSAVLSERVYCLFYRMVIVKGAVTTALKTGRVWCPELPSCLPKTALQTYRFFWVSVALAVIEVWGSVGKAVLAWLEIRVKEAGRTPRF